MARLEQILKYIGSARLAYNLTTAHNLGQPEPAYNNIAVYLDYNSHSLDFWSAHLVVRQNKTSILYEPRYEAHYPKLGVPKMNLAEGADQMEQAMKQFFFTLASTLVGTDLRAVMLGGEASSEDMDRFRELLTKALPEDCKLPVRDWIDLVYVCASGAAARARDWVLTQANAEHDER